MEKYKNEKYLKKEIMEQSRHLFIYGYNNEHRSNFLQNIEKEYPIQFDSDKPFALYFNSLGLPKSEVDLNEKDNYLIHAASREYLYFTIASKILERTMELDNIDLDRRLLRLIALTNDGYSEIKTLTELLKEMKISKEFYYEKYINFTKGMIEKKSIDDIAIPFLQIEMFIKEYKKAMNIDSYLGIIIDKKTPLAIPSVQEINNLISGRINKDISIKIVTEPDDWETYINTNGQFIESVHDYGKVELDDSYKKYMKTLTKHL